MYYRKKAMVMVMSIVCALLTLVTSVLGDTIAPVQVSQTDQTSQPTNTGTPPVDKAEYKLSTSNSDTQPVRKTHTVVSWRSDTPDQMSEVKTEQIAREITSTQRAQTTPQPAPQPEPVQPAPPVQEQVAKALPPTAPEQASAPNTERAQGTLPLNPAEKKTPGTPVTKPVAPAKDTVKPAPAPKVSPQPKPKPAVKPAPKPKPKPAPKPKAVQKAGSPGFISRVISMTRGLMNRAVSWLGTRYVWGGLSRKGVDCSGFTKVLFKSEGVNLPRTAKQQYKAGKPVGRKSLLPGDLVFFNTRGPISHVGVYIGNNKFIHAANPRRGVRMDSLGSAYYHKRYAGARRVLNLG